ncbi:MAG: hypothetical protein DRM99_03790, partial [Thermoplasmata archaeon]
MYEPKEDSELIAEFLKDLIKKEKPTSFLDMGCGTGIQTKTALKSGIQKSNILAVDINQKAVKETQKLGVKAVNSDLFAKLGKAKFDLIAFNPPYLPKHKHDKSKETTGGKYGWEIIKRFLIKAKQHLTERGKILLIFSSLTNKKKVNELIKNNGFSFKELAKRKFFMEELYL